MVDNLKYIIYELSDRPCVISIHIVNIAGQVIPVCFPVCCPHYISDTLPTRSNSKFSSKFSDERERDRIRDGWCMLLFFHCWFLCDSLNISRVGTSRYFHLLSLLTFSHNPKNNLQPNFTELEGDPSVL